MKRSASSRQPRRPSCRAGRGNTASRFGDDDGSLVFNTNEKSLKGRTLRRDPRAALCVDDERPPFSFVTVTGTVELSTDPHELLRWATIIGGRYMGTGRAEEYGTRNGVPGELLCRLRPTHGASAEGVAL